MATTVSYKSNTITTIDYGDSATLTTEGTWLEDDITINVGSLNTQSKTVTPTTSTQIVVPDNYQTFCDNVNESLSNGSDGATALTYKIINTMPPTSGYLRINGIAYVYTYDGAACKAKVVFSNCIKQISPYALIAASDAGVTITNEGSNKTFWNSDFKNIVISYNTGANPDLRISFGFDTAYSTNIMHLELENFTVDYNTENVWEKYDVLSQVTVNAIPSNYVIPTGTLQISGNGTYDVMSYASAEVNMASSINNQNKTVTPSESQQTISADSGYSGLGTVTVNAISSTYVGSGITRRSSSDLTASGATVTVPSGYYSSQATKSVSTTTHPNPTVSVNTSTGLITASHTQTAGYVSANTTTGTSQLSTQAAATITPTTSSQVAVAAGKYTLGAITVGAIPSNYVDSSSLKTYYTGSSAPSAATGNNGDLYFQTSGV